MTCDMARMPMRDTAPELALRASLARLGLHSPERDVAELPGRPDLVLREDRAALFAHGCFWHHHAGCRHARMPNTTYPWQQKFVRTRARDRATRDALVASGWRVLWVWECALTGGDAVSSDTLDATVKAFLDDRIAFREVSGSGVGPDTAADAA
ncbi:very short patch repair endonuclease [Roseomonas sp. GCM10028921]